DHPRRSRYRERLALIHRQRLPQRLTGSRVECGQTPIEDADEHLSLVQGDPTVYDVAAPLRREQWIDLWIPLPTELTRSRVDGEHDRPASRRVHLAGRPAPTRVTLSGSRRTATSRSAGVGRTGSSYLVNAVLMSTLVFIVGPPAVGKMT